MSEVSAAFLAVLQSPTLSRDCVWVCEIYAHDALPGATGYDPINAEECFASVEDVTFRTRTYRRQVKSFGSIDHNKSGGFPNASLTFDNTDRYMTSFHLTSEIEGMIIVVRTISLSVSVNLDDSLVQFVGKCEKPGDVTRTDFPLNAKIWLGSVDIDLPKRKFTQDDDEGRRRNDPLFEGFPFLPRQGSFSFQVREPRTGLGMLLGLKKTVTKTMERSSHSAVDANKAVPICFGRTQMSGLHVGYGDFGNSIAMITAWADGVSNGIYGYANIRNITPNFTALIRNAGDTWMHPTMNAYLTYGELGGTGGQLTAPIAGTQAPNVGLGYYSRTAWSYTYVNGSQVDVDDPAPELASIIYGCEMPTPTAGVWGAIKLSDNPCDIWRYIINDPYLMNVPSAMIDDVVLWESCQYCNQYLVDEVNTDTVILRTEETTKAGVDYKLWKSTGVATPDHFKWLNGEDVNPFGQEAEYNFEDLPPIENGGGGGGPDPTNPDAPTKYRRRYTFNAPLTEVQKAVDVLKNILYPAFRGYVTYGANGKIQLRVDKPADHSLIRSDIAIGVTEIPVYSILAWRTGQLLKGQVVIGAHLNTSEVKTVTSTRYTVAGNSITLTASGGVTASGATLTGGDDANLPATGTVTVTSAVGTKTVTIDGIPVVLIPETGDTTATIAGRIAAAVNSHSILTQYVSASWTPGTAIVTLTSKLGFLIVSATINAHTGPIASPGVAPVLVAAAGGNLAAGAWKVAYSYETDEGETLVSPSASVTVTANQKINVSAITPPAGVTGINWYMSRLVASSVLKYYLSNSGAAHSILKAPNQTAPFVPARNTTAEEVIRIARSYANRANVQADCTRSNMLEKSFKWPLGSREKSVNKGIGKYREASDDFRPTELRVRDSRHIAKVGKELPFEVNLSGVDNFHQAVRLMNGYLAEKRDADFFVSLASDGESLLLDVGDLIAVTELDNAGVGFVNLLVRIEDKKISESTNARVDFVARKYASSLYDDDVYERNIPLPTKLTPKKITGVLVISDLGGSRVITEAEARNGIISIPATTVLTSTLTLVVPDHTAAYIVQNLSGGAFDVQLKTPTGSATVMTKGAESLAIVDIALAVKKVSDSKNQENVIEDINPVAPLYFNDLGGKAWEIGVTPAASNPTGQFLRGDAGWSNILQPTAAIVGLTIRGAASQTADLTQWQNSSGTTIAKVTANGSFQTIRTSDGTVVSDFNASLAKATFRYNLDVIGAGGVTLFAVDSGSERVTIISSSASANMFMIRGAAAQTGDLTQWQNSGGTTLTAIDAAGKLVFQADTNLYRSAAHVLKTDDKLRVELDVEINNGALTWVADGNGDIGTSSNFRPASIYAMSLVQAPSLSLGGGVTWTKASGAPSGACTSGCLYSDTATGELYVCESTAWVRK